MQFGETTLAIASRLIRPPGLVGQGGDSLYFAADNPKDIKFITQSVYATLYAAESSPTHTLC